MSGSLWSFNYFFYNRKLKRILFFSCAARPKARARAARLTLAAGRAQGGHAGVRGRDCRWG